jgi:hypothetical protein
MPLPQSSFGFDKEEITIISRLDKPWKIQDYLGGLKQNHEKDGETCRSPRRVMRDRTAHCMEGAMFAAVALWVHGEKPLILDLKTGKGDDDHVVTLFRAGGKWGAISKTNHAVLRYRDPVYANVHELVMSYFHEYFLDSGRKTLRSYSDPFDLSKLKDRRWITSEKDLWHMPRALDKSLHHDLLTSREIKNLRLAEKIEREAGKIVE